MTKIFCSDSPDDYIEVRLGGCDWYIVASISEAGERSDVHLSDAAAIELARGLLALVRERNGLSPDPALACAPGP